MVVVCVPVPVPVNAVRDGGDSKGKRATSAFTQRWVVLLLATCALALTFAFASHFPTQQQALEPTQRPQADAGQAPTTQTSPTERPGGKPCGSVSLFVDPRKIAERQRTKPPRITLIYITKRPGGYDMLLHSLSQLQLPPNVPSLSAVLEVVCVDELSSYRASRVYAMAEELGVPVVAVVPSKPKSRLYFNTRFNIYNAINTGLLLARGDIVTFLMDLAWVPANYLTRTLEFYDDPKFAKSFLAYPERFFHLYAAHVPKGEALKRPNSLTVFAHNITKPLSALREEPGGGSKYRFGYTRPADAVTDFLNGRAHGFEKQPRLDTPQGADMFWELSFASCPFRALELLNGAEEVWDKGDDSHEANIRLRSEFLGYDLWLDGQTVVECLWHKNQFEAEGDTWNRYSDNSVSGDVIIHEMGDITRRKRGVESAGHDFNLTTWRQHDCAAWVGTA